MAEYNERTGTVNWKRVVLASQRAVIEKLLSEHYPVQAAQALKPRQGASSVDHGTGAGLSLPVPTKKAC